MGGPGCEGPLHEFALARPRNEDAAAARVAAQHLSEQLQPVVATTSRRSPRALGVLLMVSCLCYLANTFGVFLVPRLDPAVSTIITLPTAVAEFWMIGYLLTVGVRARRPPWPRPDG